MSNTKYVSKDFISEAYEVGSDKVPSFLESVSENRSGGYTCKIRGGNSVVAFQGEWVLPDKGGIHLISDSVFREKYVPIRTIGNGESSEVELGSDGELSDAIDHVRDLLSKDDFPNCGCKEDHERLLGWLEELEGFRRDDREAHANSNQTPYATLDGFEVLRTAIPDRKRRGRPAVYKPFFEDFVASGEHSIYKKFPTKDEAKKFYISAFQHRKKVGYPIDIVMRGNSVYLVRTDSKEGA